MVLNQNNQFYFLLDIINFPTVGNPPPPIQEIRIICENTEEPRDVSELTQELRIT